MTLLRMDNVAIVFEDLDAAVTFFQALGLELEGRTTVEGPSVGEMIGLEDVRSDIAMLRMPDGHGRLELTRYISPAPVRADPWPASPNTLGGYRIMFAVDDIDAVMARLRPLGAEPMGDATYKGLYRICYLRGPEGVIVALAQQLTDKRL